MKMKLTNKLIVFFSILSIGTAEAQTISLDSCRAMAMRNNKEMGVARMKKIVTAETKRAARTKYLPHLDVVGGYMYSSREMSILNDDQKYLFGNIGTIGATTISEKAAGLKDKMSAAINGSMMNNAHLLDSKTAMALGGIVNDMQGAFGQMGQQMMQQLAAAGDEMGQRIVEAFETNTHHMFTASAMVTQPIYMGGAITAANDMADIADDMAETNIRAMEHNVLFGVDNAYWTVVSLKQKQRLADAYLALVQKLNDDIHKMIKEGVATRADGLKVDVAVNEAEMTKAKVDNGLALSKMFLCQMCGMPMDSNIMLEDEDKENLEAELVSNEFDIEAVKENRPELQLLNGAIALSEQKTKLSKAGRLPQVALMTGAVFSNPSVYNGFERKFKGAFNIGVMVRMPVLDWGETASKIRISQNATEIAKLQYEEAEEKIELQVNQASFRVREANKNLITARKNIQRAEENLRCANIGFKEGVMQTSDVMAAQTAWLQAQTQKVDAEIDVKLSEVAMKKALGEF